MSTDKLQYTEDEIRAIAREEAQQLYDDISVQDAAGNTWSLSAIADRVSQLAPDLRRREVLKTSLVVIGYIGAGYSLTSAIVAAFSEPAAADNVGELGTTADPLVDLHTAAIDGGGSAISVGDDLDGGSSQSLTNWSSLDVGGLTFDYPREPDTVTNVGATYTIDVTDKAFLNLTMTDNTSFSFTNVDGSLGQSVYIILKQDGTGGRTPSWPSNVIWRGGSEPNWSTSANAVDEVTFTYDSEADEWLGHGGTGFV